MASRYSPSVAGTDQGASHGVTHTTHSSTVTQMLSDTKAYCKSLVLRLRGKRSKEECQGELRRIVEDMKKDVSDNIDAIIQQVTHMQPKPGCKNYENVSRLYDSILDQMIQMMEDLEKTFTGIFTQFNENMELLWLAIVDNKEDQLRTAQLNFQATLDRYNKQWTDTFQHANQKVWECEKELTKASI